MPDLATLRYQPFYCEENAFHLAQDPRLAARAPAAVFVSGPEGACVMWHQKAARRPAAPMTWDYHVFVLVRYPWEILDFDTTLGFPVPAGDYLRRSFRPEVALPAELTPLFRVVGAEALAATLASDRSHMRDREGRYQRPPPPWPPIGAAGVASNLGRFLAMEEVGRAGIAGEVVSLAALLTRVAAG